MYFYTLEELIKYNPESFWKKSFNVIKLFFYKILVPKKCFFLSLKQYRPVGRKGVTCPWQ